jgi:hypothetical protein
LQQPSQASMARRNWAGMIREPANETPKR